MIKETSTKVEIVKPDPEVLRLVEAVLSQNMRILDMNAMLLEALANPTVRIS